MLIACILALFLLNGISLLLRHVADLPIPDWIIVRLDPNEETNIPTWFSSVLLAGVSATALLIHRLRSPSGRAPSFERWFWLFFGAVYAYLSLDEAARLHEELDFLGPGSKWVFYYAPAAALVFAVCAYYFVHQRGDDHILRNWIIGGLVLTALGALLGEYLSYALPMTKLVLRIEVTLEELAEMVGTLMVLMGCLRELERRFNRRFAGARQRG